MNVKKYMMKNMYLEVINIVFRVHMKKYFFLYLFIVLFIITNIIWVIFDDFINIFQYCSYIKFGNIYFRFGIDSISFFFIYLTALLISLCLLFSILSRSTSNDKINNSVLLFIVGLLLLVVFYTLDLLIFYISFEMILVPFFIYIGVTGYRKRRIHAAYLFFFYTLIGSFFMLISIFFIYLYTGTTDLEVIWNVEWLGNLQYILWFSLFLTFAIKIPMFPFHIWSPEAHVEAPTEGSVILAGLLLKLGTYGFLRYQFPIFTELNFYFSPFVVTLASVGIIYSSLSTLRQIDIKRVIAYSSIAHMNMCMLGIFSYNEIAFVGSIFLMIGHGIVSGGLFYIIGMVYNRYRTKIIHYLSGIINFMPVLCFFFFMFLLGNIGMPGTSNFIGELLIMLGIMYQGSYISIISASIGIFLCTVYSFWMYNKIIFMIPKYNYTKIPDLFFYEIIILIILLILMLLFGIFPNSITSILNFQVLYFFLECFN